MPVLRYVDDLFRIVRDELGRPIEVRPPGGRLIHLSYTKMGYVRVYKLPQQNIYNLSIDNLAEHEYIENLGNKPNQHYGDTNARQS